MTHYGTLDIDGDRASVEFERILDATIDAVWDLVSTGAGLEKWLAPASVDLRVGGTMDIDFGEEGLAGGAIVDLSPGSVLEYRWGFPGEPESIIRFELESLGDGRTRLRLHHRLLPAGEAVSYGAGWHAHLDQLAFVAAGGADFDWTARFEELTPQYQAAV